MKIKPSEIHRKKYLFSAQSCDSSVWGQSKGRLEGSSSASDTLAAPCRLAPWEIQEPHVAVTSELGRSRMPSTMPS